MRVAMMFIILSACSTTESIQSRLDAEEDFHSHQKHLESIYNLDNYDPEYVDDCLHYEELVCEFE